MDDRLSSLVREMGINGHNVGIRVNEHPYPFTLSTAESHVDWGRTDLVHGKTKRARAHFRYALNDFVEIGEYRRAYSIAESYGLLAEIRRLFQKKLSYLNTHGMFEESAVIKDLMHKKRDSKYEDLTDTFKL